MELLEHSWRRLPSLGRIEEQQKKRRESWRIELTAPRQKYRGPAVTLSEEWSPRQRMPPPSGGRSTPRGGIHRPAVAVLKDLAPKTIYFPFMFETLFYYYSISFYFSFSLT